jgi:hypothetical protein
VAARRNLPAVLQEPDGQEKVIGSGPTRFLEAKNSPEMCRRKMALSFKAITAPPAHMVQQVQRQGREGNRQP